MNSEETRDIVWEKLSAFGESETLELEKILRAALIRGQSHYRIYMDKHGPHIKYIEYRFGNRWQRMWLRIRLWWYTRRRK